jgi:hypothetical protein
MEMMPFGFTAPREPGHIHVDPMDDEALDTATTTLDMLVDRVASNEGVQIRTLPAGTRLTVTTAHSCYELVVLDGLAQRVQVTGGTRVALQCGARMEGATAGGTALQGGWIRIGLRMEMTDGQRRITTSPVRSIQIS